MKRIFRILGLVLIISVIIAGQIYVYAHHWTEHDFKILIIGLVITGITTVIFFVSLIIEIVRLIKHLKNS